MSQTLQAFLFEELKRHLWERAAGLCGICLEPVALGHMQIDHVIPVSRGGSHEESNLQAAHALCNARKGSHLPGDRSLADVWGSLRAELERIADSEHRKLTNLIIHALREWLAGRGRPQP